MSLFRLVRSFVDLTPASPAATTSPPPSPPSPHSHSSPDGWHSSSFQLSPMSLEQAAQVDASTARGSSSTSAVNRSLKHRWEPHNQRTAAIQGRSQRRRLHSNNIAHDDRAQRLIDDDYDSDIDTDGDDDSKHSLPSSQSSHSSATSYPSHSSSSSSFTTAVPPSMDVRVSMSVTSDYSAMLSMGYTIRQARYATRLFNGDEEQALLYLLDMEQHKDALEIQITQAELEAADEKESSSGRSGGGARPASASGNSTSTWMRILPRFTALSNTLMSLSPQSASLKRAQSQPLPADHAHSSSSLSPSPSPIPVEDPSAPLSRVPNHPPVPSPPSPPLSPFACDTCTYVNEALGTAHCELCGTARPQSIEQREWSASLQPCAICFDLFPLSSMCTGSAPCGHLFCWSCFHSYLLSQLDDNRLLELHCPQPSCSRPILCAEVKAVLSPYHYARYRRFRQSAVLAADPRVRYCPNRRCQHVLYGSTDNPRMQCDKCGEWSCYTCQIPWHEGLSCLQVLRHTELRGPTADDVAFLQSMHAQLGSRYRQCPRCGVWVERSAGCAKMTCRCSARWCFECGVINATCNCTPRYHVFYPLATVLSNWNNEGPE